MTSSLERRVEDLRRRVLIRSWGYRQRRNARGVWYRLRRLLADASAAFVISRDEASRLAGEGLRVDPVGRALEPPKMILLVPPDRLARIPSARPIPVRLGQELLEAECLALTTFPDEGKS